MKEVKASIWDKQWDGYWRVIPINTVVKADGSLVMGAGLAKQAAERYPDLPKELGNHYRQKGVNVGITLVYACRIIAFPTKFDWKKNSDLALIESGLKELKFWILNEYKIICPWLGCGLGGLDWEKDVKPLVEKYFGDDDNFVVVNL